MASHQSNLIAQYAHRVCILRNRKIAALDTAERIFNNFELLNETGIQPVINCKLELLNKKSGNDLYNSIIEIKDFGYKYKNGTSIENINLTIFENDFTAIIGRNGSGKTTLLKGISGLLLPACGEITVKGRNTKDISVSEISKEIGFVMQNPTSQLFTDSVFNEVAFALKNMRHEGFKLPKKEIKIRVEDALNTVGFTESYDLLPHACNRSNQVKIMFACVLAMGAKIILLDEVDVGNDYKGSIDIMNLAKELHLNGFTIIFVTHNMNLVSEYAHRLIKIQRNEIIQLW